MNSTIYKFSIIVVLFFTAVIYAPGMQGGFHLDDYPNILNNPLVETDNLTADELWQSAMSGNAGPLKRPVSMLSFGINTYFTGKDPFAMKVTNLAIHLLTGFILILISRIILNSWKEKGFLQTDTHLLSLLIGLCWLIHPFNLTSVLYIVQRMTSLSSLFAVASIYFYCLIRIKPFNIGRCILFSTLMGLAAGLSLLSKETAVLIPFQIFVIELCVFRFFYKNYFEKLYLISFHGITVLIPLLYLGFHLTTNIDAYSNSFSFREFSMLERLLTEPSIVLWYLKMTLIPDLTHMGLLLDSFKISHSIFNPPSTIVFIGIILTMIITAGLSLKKFPFIAFGILWFYISHSLESTILSLELAFEHRNYLASYGIVLLFITSILFFLNNTKFNKFALIFCFAWAMALAYTTHIRVDHWESPLKLAIYDAEHHPNSERAHMVLAETYKTIYTVTKDDNLKQTLFDSSLKHLNIAIKLDPESLSPRMGKLLLLSRAKIILPEKEASLLYSLLQSGNIDASTINSFQHLTDCVIKNKCHLNKLTYIRLISNALSNKNINKVYKANLLIQYSQFLSIVLNNFDDAISFCEEAIAINPHKLIYNNFLIQYLVQVGNFNEARNVLNNYKRKDVNRKNHLLIKEWDTFFATKNLP